MNLSSASITAPAVCLAVLLSACGGGGGDDSGTLRLALTDAPACGFDRVDVTVQKVRVHKSGSANEADDGWSEVVLNPAKRVDLLSLTNGALAELGQTPLPAGKYNQMRFVLAPNDAANPLANSVTPTGGVETAVSTPSGAQSGLKMNVDIQVEADKVADFALDFDTCRSFVRLGNSGYVLKPVIAVIPRISDAVTRVTGQVALPIATSATSVSLQLNGQPVRSTPPDSTGRFVLYPVPVGVYDLVITAPGRVVTTITGVPVTLDEPRPPSTSRRRRSIRPRRRCTRPRAPFRRRGIRSTRWSASPSSISGVRRSRSPAARSTARRARSVTRLPASAPVRAAFAASAAAVALTADTGTPTGKYTLVGVAGATTKTLDFDVTSADFVVPTWVFP